MGKSGEYGPSTYGDRIAEVYDEWFGLPADAEAAVEFLAGMGPGPALELGIGTGRVALPLSTRGVEVHGVDSSEPMVMKLRGKPEAIASRSSWATSPTSGTWSNGTSR